ncbi:MAG: hypothetical protein PWR24_653 [Desulfonauticus sp.]|jgi:hypothetical protein|nr:MAG: hypothetical protein XD41_0425 [Desulfonauticus sp. 38_4375]MDK2921096.1 hypothetical protein [Desulfonauticus sp.]
MHEISLNQVITDYLTGKEIELTTYEDLRQSLAKILVEEKGYPKKQIKPKVKLKIQLKDCSYDIVLDFVVFNEENQPMLLLAFCAGEVASFVRQYVAAARLFTPPIPLVLVTDTKEAYLVQAKDKKVLEKGYFAIPTYEELKVLVQKAPLPNLEAVQREKESCVAHAYFALSDSCCSRACQLKDKSE